MKFKVGDKVKVTKAFLLKLPTVGSRVKDGGVITHIYTNKVKAEAKVRFYSGYTYHIYCDSLELRSVKNQQLLFSFMSEIT